MAHRKLHSTSLSATTTTLSKTTATTTDCTFYPSHTLPLPLACLRQFSGFSLSVCCAAPFPPRTFLEVFAHTDGPAERKLSTTRRLNLATHDSDASYSHNLSCSQHKDDTGADHKFPEDGS